MYAEIEYRNAPGEKHARYYDRVVAWIAAFAQVLDCFGDARYKRGITGFGASGDEKRARFLTKKK